jgi:hypothetical protein
MAQYVCQYVCQSQEYFSQPCGPAPAGKRLVHVVPGKKFKKIYGRMRIILLMRYRAEVRFVAMGLPRVHIDDQEGKKKCSQIL